MESNATSGPPLSRRTVLLTGAAAVAWPGLAAAGLRPSGDSVRLVAASGSVSLVGPPHPDSRVWCYNGRVPGPEIRVRQGTHVRIEVENRLEEETTVHWHGLRVPNAMDGVPHLTQAPVPPGGRYLYEFTVHDAGTYWYHPHQRSFEQVGRGLYGAFIVEEQVPVPVDRDVVWILDDWRLDQGAQISGDFANLHDISHAGRVGNTVTVNGRIPDRFAVRSGERVRLRLINAANARIFGLAFAGHRPQVIALDGQPVTPHEPADGRVVLGPAMRADLIIDMTGRPGERFTVADTFYRRLQYRLIDLVYDPEPLRERPSDALVTLPANTMPEPELAAAERHEIVFSGGMMGNLRTARMDGREVGFRDMLGHGMAWAVNGSVAAGHMHDPVLELVRGRSYVLALRNDTAWHHPMHLHGHAFRVIGRNGMPWPRREWLDTVLLVPREEVEIAFVADNPGDWMFHCHILEHQAGGMMAVVRVA